MRIKKAQAWIHNASNSDIVLSDLDLKIRSKQTVNLFALRPRLTYEAYLRSKNEGSLFAKRRYLIAVSGPKIKEPPIVKEMSTAPITSRNRSIVGTAQSNKEFFSELDSEFPRDTNLSQEDVWKAEREKMLQSLDLLEQGDDGEVFSDNIFDDGEEDLDGFDY